MSVNHTENDKNSETTLSLQPFVLFLLALAGGFLVVIPLIPVWVNNVAYSFSGEAPKVYWYLARASGLVALTILWLSMALGLGITNKLARRWPGAPAAFAIHEYVSLLGLAFAAYHGLVLMGDHFVDFSLPRLLTPFSIAYKTFWVGLGQLAFYTWIAVAFSFYIRKSIGPKVWRSIHYINFATYTMGLTHGLFSGTDSSIPWLQGYYWFSGLSLLALAAYRIYEAKLRPALPLTNPARPVAQRRVVQAKAIPASGPVETVASRHVPTIPTPKSAPELQSQPAPAQIQAQETRSIATEPVIDPAEVMTEAPLPSPAPDPISAQIASQTSDTVVAQSETASANQEQHSDAQEPLRINVPAQPEKDETPVLRIRVPAVREEVVTPVLRLRIKKVVQDLQVQPTAPEEADREPVLEEE